MSLYLKLRQNPPKLEVPTNTTKIMIHLVSVMCDNKYLMKLEKFTTGWKLNTLSQAFTNFQMKCYQYEIEWAADEKNWNKVFELLNSGTSVVEKITCR